MRHGLSKKGVFLNHLFPALIPYPPIGILGIGSSDFLGTWHLTDNRHFVTLHLSTRFLLFISLYTLGSGLGFSVHHRDRKVCFPLFFFFYLSSLCCLPRLLALSLSFFFFLMYYAFVLSIPHLFFSLVVPHPPPSTTAIV